MEISQENSRESTKVPVIMVTGCSVEKDSNDILMIYSFQQNIDTSVNTRDEKAAVLFDSENHDVLLMNKIGILLGYQLTEILQ
jgi:hypothetical protein